MFNNPGVFNRTFINGQVAHLDREYLTSQAIMSDKSNFESWPGKSPGEMKRLRLYVNLVNAGLAHGILLSGEAAVWYKQAQEVLADEKDDEEPPKPPRRPNARIGQVALEKGF